MSFDAIAGELRNTIYASALANISGLHKHGDTLRVDLRVANVNALDSLLAASSQTCEEVRSILRSTKLVATINDGGPNSVPTWHRYLVRLMRLLAIDDTLRDLVLMFGSHNRLAFELSFSGDEDPLVSRATLQVVERHLDRVKADCRIEIRVDVESTEQLSESARWVEEVCILGYRNDSADAVSAWEYRLFPNSALGAIRQLMVWSNNATETPSAEIERTIKEIDDLQDSIGAMLDNVQNGDSEL